MQFDLYASKNQLPDYYYCNGRRYVYSYTFYNDGYVESVTWQPENEKNNYITETYFWE